jgi:hypothetical protein
VLAALEAASLMALVVVLATAVLPLWMSAIATLAVGCAVTTVLGLLGSRYRPAQPLDTPVVRGKPDGVGLRELIRR